MMAWQTENHAKFVDCLTTIKFDKELVKCVSKFYHFSQAPGHSASLHIKKKKKKK